MHQLNKVIDEKLNFNNQKEEEFNLELDNDFPFYKES